MMEWPQDWPEDKRVGPEFLAELMKRYPSRIKGGAFEVAVEEVFGEEKGNEGD